MQGGLFKKLRRFRVAISLYVIVSIIIGSFGDGLIFSPVPKAEAAEVTIDSDVSTTVTEQLQSGTNSVFISDQVGYKFFVDAPGYCVYRKTSNGGSTWGATTTVDSQTDCTQISIWYDKWTPGSASSSIHIATLDPSADDIWYNRLDTDSDSLLLGSAPVSMFTGTGQGGTSLTAGENFVSITRATDGTIYAVSNDGSGTNDSAILECTSSCNNASSWTERTPQALDIASDQNVLVPLAGGDIMIIQRDISANILRSRIWDESAGSWLAYSTIDPNGGGDNTTYDVGFSATVSSSTPGNVYLAYAADYDVIDGNEDVRVGFFNGTTWSTSTLTNVISNSATRGITGVAISIDTSNEDVYVAYSARTTPGTANTANIYWKVATSSMKNWSAERGPINVGADEIYGVDLNIASDERIFVSWYETASDDIYGDTIADIFPGIHASGTGTQTTSTLASTTDFYVGGKFMFYNTYSRRSFDVTGITISEGGTIDASTALDNVRLVYEMDNSAPYDCASESYAGTEDPFGSIDTNGFSGADGVSSFSGTTVTISTTTALCVYPVMDVLDSAISSTTIDISISDPTTDVTVTDSTAGPATVQNIATSTRVFNDTPTLTHYHWRNDDGTQATATSKTSGVEDTALTSMRQGSTTRLRIQVSNEGSSSTPAMQYRLEYASNPGTCDAATGWINVGDTGGDFDMSDSIHLPNATNTTNIATGVGGMTDANTTFLTPNGGVLDTSSQTGNIVLTPFQFVELEYSIVASTSASEGSTYCFRVTNQGEALFTYDQIPRANIAADVLVTVATSSQIASTSIPISNIHIGSSFVITENTGTRNVTSITIAEDGSVDASTGLDNIRLRYDLDSSSPYNCASESFFGNELQFGATSTASFSGPNGSTTFTGSVAISTTSTMCLYVLLDVTASAQNNETANIIMEDPSTNFVVSGGGSVSPTITRDMNGTTTLRGAILTQTHYHWRSDNGTEVSATSLSRGLEDTAVTNVGVTTPVRLRMQVSNEGTVTSASTTLRLEYGAKISTCSAVSAWTDVGGVGGAWDMATTTNLVDASSTTNIAVASGGVTDDNPSFLTPNSAVKDASSTVATTTLTSTQFIETEHSIKQTADAGFDVPYCFRLTNAGTELNAYTRYAELTTAPERDFEIQRGTTTIANRATTTTIVAGVDYTAPSASTSAFIRINNIGLTGAGHNTGATAAQNATNTTAYIVNPSNIMTSVTFARTGVSSTTRISWEIIEFIGEPGSDNEMIVRQQSFLTYGVSSTSATGTTATGIVDDADVVVFITGQQSPDIASTNYEPVLNTSGWDASSDRAYFQRNATGSDAVRVSYTVVEFTGQNWAIQRVSHTFAAAGVTETESITALSSLTRTFIHTQKRNGIGLNGTDEMGAEVWLSSIGQVSFFLEAGATTPNRQTSVVWIIENTQTSAGAMEVTRSSGGPPGGTAPLTISLSIGKTLTDLTNASLFVNGRSTLTTAIHTRAFAGATIASSTHFELWRSNTGSTLTFRAEIVEWPTAGLAVMQDAYQFYEHNNALDPTDRWPGSEGPLGESTVLTGSDNPLGEGERIRIRMNIKALNATMPAGTRAFRLQYGVLTSTCGAIPSSGWTTLGNSASSTVWRGYNATGTTDGTLLSDLNIASSDVLGTFEEENDTDINASALPAGDDMEFDWLIEQNGANAETYYCFRMVEGDGTPLDSYSTTYPQLRTASFTPRSQNWRWYDDEGSVTPVTALGLENVAPVDIVDDQIVKLRVTVKEIKNIARDDVRFRLQYSEYASFSQAFDVVASSTCIATSTWCYASGAGIDNALIASSTLSDSESCLGGVGSGCGTHNESPDILTGFRHEADASVEYEFTVQSALPRVNRVYYFRLYDIVQDIPVTTNSGESYPSLVTEGASLSFTMEGIASTTVIEGVTLDIDTTPTTLNFGVLGDGATVEGAHRLGIESNGTEGYQLLMMMDGDLMSSGGTVIEPITGTNAVPVAWNTGCAPTATSCFGYHSSDDTLEGGSTRFSAIDTYARLSTTTLEEIAYSSSPVPGETFDIVFRVLRRALQSAGQYETNIMYISIPMF